MASSLAGQVGFDAPWLAPSPRIDPGAIDWRRAGEAVLGQSPKSPDLSDSCFREAFLSGTVRTLTGIFAGNTIIEMPEE